MAKARIVPPSGSPVSLDAIKTHLRVETADEDAYLAELATTASAHVEHHCGICLLNQTWRFCHDGLPLDGCVAIGLGPVQSIAAVTAYGTDGQPTVLDPSGYSLDRVSELACLRFSAEIAPAQTANGVEIDAVCGFGESGAEVPDELRRAVLVLAAHWHALRGAADDAALAGLVPASFDRLTAPWRRVRL